jgi:hypothetical protein
MPNEDAVPGSEDSQFGVVLEANSVRPVGNDEYALTLRRLLGRLRELCRR